MSQENKYYQPAARTKYPKAILPTMKDIQIVHRLIRYEAMPYVRKTEILDCPKCGGKFLKKEGKERCGLRFCNDKYP